MRIASVTATIYHQKVVHRRIIPAAFRAGKPVHTTVLVRVETDDGLVGWGEGFGHYGMAPATRDALVQAVAPRVVGQDAGDGELTGRISQALYASSASGPVAYALSGLDIALWDLRAKARGIGLHELISSSLPVEGEGGGGGEPDTALRAYASFTRYADPDVVREETREALRRGYAGVKLHEVRLPEIEAAAGPCREAGVPLMVDANCHWSPAQARDVWRRMPGLLWLEEPVWPPENHEALADLRVRHGVPTAAGECAPSVIDFERMMRSGAVSYAQPSVTKIGGVTALVRLVRGAQASGIRVAPHTPYYGPGLLATLHVCAALAPDALIEHLFYDFESGPFGNAVIPRQGRFELPRGPGLGVEPDLTVLDAIAEPAR